MDGVGFLWNFICRLFMLRSFNLYTDFGYVKYQPMDAYKRGDVVYTKFVSGNPRNNLMTDSSYFIVEQKQPDGNWKTIANDGN